MTGNTQLGCAILPILEAATSSRYCNIGRDDSGERFSARRSPPAHTWSDLKDRAGGRVL